MGEISKITQHTHTKFLNFYELDTVKKTGKAGKYYVASRAKEIDGLEIRRGKTRADGVAMYILTGEKRDKVLLIRQFRWPIGNYVYEFPAGLVEEGESFRDAAVREVYEETGLVLTPLDVDPMYERPFYMTDGMTDEAYGFDIPVPAMDEEFPCAILGSKGTWYDHMVSVSDPVPMEG